MNSFIEFGYETIKVAFIHYLWCAHQVY